MPYTRLFIWVEGDDDVRMFNMLVHSLFPDNYNSVEVRKYAQEIPTKIDNFIKSIKAMKAQYIFVSDIDSSPSLSDKKQKLQQKYKSLEADRILIIVQEIESWYIAGIEEEFCRKIGIKYIHLTDDLTKEKFNNMMPKQFDSRIDFMLELLKHFSIDLAKDRNTSFNYFLERFR